MLHLHLLTALKRLNLYADGDQICFNCFSIIRFTESFLLLTNHHLALTTICATIIATMSLFVIAITSMSPHSA
jgi:hypothetical protein